MNELDREVSQEEIDLEPLIHSHITDGFPQSHKFAGTTIYCDKCEDMLHASNNECMQTWVEFRHIKCNVCIKCFSDPKYEYNCLED